MYTVCRQRNPWNVSMTIRKTSLFIILAIVLNTTHAQKMYKWVDENGTTHYSKKSPEKANGEQLSLPKKRVGDQQCCNMVRRVVNSMMNRNINNGTYNREYEALYKSENFNVNELNNFVGYRVKIRMRQSEITQLAYSNCMNAGFKFCRTPFSNDPQNSKNARSLSGSGFIVSEDGYIVTNEHVAGSCRKIIIQPMNKVAKLIAKDANIDLAILKIDGGYKDFASFSVNTAILGESVVAAGFPYKKLLSSSIKISTGIVSSLAGVLNDKKVVQITAPIQPGNSGGPLIDLSGNIVGIVVSKLNSKLMFKMTDDIPQNVNFAIKAKYAKTFLKKHNIKFKQQASLNKYDIPTISQAAEDYTVEINCIQ